MSGSRGTTRVLIVAGDADGNLGDRAILHATCDELRSIDPALHITVVSNRPSSAPQGVDTVPSGSRGFARLLRAATRADLVICGGGGLFQDDDSLIKMPYWALRVLLLRLYCRRIVGFSLGVGPLSAWTSRWSARLAFSCMEDVTTRDALAQNTARECTRKPVAVVPDPAWLLAATSKSDARRWLVEQGVPDDGRPLIGVTVRRWFPPRARLVPNQIAANFRRSGDNVIRTSARLVQLLAATLDQLVRDNDARILFLPTYNVYHEGDDQLCREIQRNMKMDPGKILRIDDPHLYKGVCGQLDVLLGGRMHPTIFAAAVGAPVVALAYNPKFHGMLAMLGCERYVIDVHDFVAHELTGELAQFVSKAMSDGPVAAASIADIQRSIRQFSRKLLGEGA